MPISDATREEADRLVRRYPVARSALLPMLHLVQSDEGYVSEDGIAFCAEVLALTKAEVGAVATFYTMFKREPFGDYLLSVCTNPTCKIAGAQTIYEAYVEACGGEHVDRDAGVMVEHAECLGICDAAPVVQINYEMYGPVTHDQAMDLLAKAKGGDPPASNLSGQVPPTFRGVEREFSGIDDGVDEHLIEAARLQVAATVPPTYRSGETDIPVTHPGGDPSGHGGEVFRAAAKPVTVVLGSAQADDGSTAAGGRDDTPTDEDRTFERSESSQRVVDRLADEGRGVAQELAAAATGEGQTEAAPAADDQPPVDEGPATPAESEDDTAAGVEDEPSDSIAGTAGPDEDLEEPTEDVPSTSGVPSATRAGDRTPDGDDARDEEA